MGAHDSIKTRFIIISDTHGLELRPENKLSEQADVVVHCGDLTEGSQIDEFRAALQLLADFRAPLKLVIAGNHDMTMDIPLFREKIADTRPPLDTELVKKFYGEYGEARQLFESAASAGIKFLDEGSHQFRLENGALLTVYASPYTPSLGDWGFQYRPCQGHNFDIDKGTDLVMTHGPPKGVLDYTHARSRAGCPHLFGAVARARPRVHCFGHIHEAWGAKLVTWREQTTENPSHFTDIDNDKSTTVETLASLRPTKYDEPESRDEKLRKEDFYRQERCCSTSHCVGDAKPLKYGAQTLFVNAAIEGIEEGSLQLPWLVEIDLPRISLTH